MTTCTMGNQRRHSNNDADSEEAGNADNIHGPWKCGVPKGHACLMSEGDGMTITKEDILNADAVKMVCTNEQCPVSPFLHLACFTSFEESVLVHLKSQGRARGWSEKQRAQNLWNKRGYDLIFKACECSCEHGYVRKDLDWMPPWPPGPPGEAMHEEINGCKRKRKKSKSQSKPALTIGLPAFTNANSLHNNAVDNHHHNHNDNVHQRSDVQTVPNRNRANSLSSSTSSGSSFASCSPLDTLSASPGSHDGGHQGHHPPRRALIQDRSRHDSGGSIFQRRMDYSSFNVLPKHKINSYHIKMEDECSIGNDETRIFILSSFASNKMNRVPCVLCKGAMHIFDRYPLIDGTFFLSPRQHTKSCVQVKCEGKTSYLTAVCMSCLEGWTGNGIVCRFCLKPWSGGHFILGTMYSYDIFAAMPCCPDRFQCNTCGQLVCHPDQPFNFFSDYSQMVSCPQCGTQEAHFAKSLAVYTTKDEANKQIQMAQQQQMTFQQAGLRVHRVNSA